jgi:NAD-dependent deacetylase
MLNNSTEQLEIIAEHLRSAKRILFITGAGMSADSGLPTYRGIGGLYNNRLTNESMPIEMALSRSIMDIRPDITWHHLAEIEKACRNAKFNRGHEIIVEIEKLKPETWILTQNIDGFHRAAGSKNLIEIHGCLHDLYCTECSYQAKVKDYSKLGDIPPSCPRCNGLVRPKVVLFEEMLPESAVYELYHQMTKGFDVIFSIGTTSVFPYIKKPVMSAKNWGALTVEINPSTTEVSDFVDIKLKTTAAVTLEDIWRLLK